MRILHLNWTDVGGGAALGMYSLHSSLRNLGIDSRILVRDKQTQDEFVHGPTNLFQGLLNRFRSTVESMPVRLRSWGRAPEFQTNWLPDRWKTTIESLKPDIVHVHWAGNATVSLGTLSDLKIPVIWTLRDLWPLTGGCFYPDSCHRFQQTCGACPLLNSNNEGDVSSWSLKQKRTFWDNPQMIPVALSQWGKQMFESSHVYGEQTVHCIPNGLDIEQFSPCPDPEYRQNLRNNWRLEPGKKVLLYGAVGGKVHPRKGFDLLAEALNFLAHPEDFQLLVFGGEKEQSQIHNVSIKSIGPIQYGKELANLYRCADVCLVPSRYETFGKTAMESLACGIPVACFDTSGPRDIVDHNVNGYRATCFDVKDFARGIEFLAAHPEFNQLQKNARDKVIKAYDIRIVAQRYIELYTNCLA